MSVYFIATAGRIKIGFSRDFKHRLRNLRTMNGGDIEVIGVTDGSVQFERFLHRLLKPHRVKGEWFEDCPEVRDTVVRVAKHGAAVVQFEEVIEQPSPPKPAPLVIQIGPPPKRNRWSSLTALMNDLIDASFEKTEADPTSERSIVLTRAMYQLGVRLHTLADDAFDLIPIDEQQFAAASALVAEAQRSLADF